MDQDAITALFDQQAAGYDAQWARMAPIRDCLYFLLESFLVELPGDARVLCVGVGTGVELAHLAALKPAWRFTVVEPSAAMLEVCRKRAEHDGFAARCAFHEGYLDSLPAGAPHHAATCFLVSQFILDQQARAEFFRTIARRLEPGAVLVSSDLAADTDSPGYDGLLRAWMGIMARSDISPEGIERMRKAYAHDVGVIPAATVASIIEAGGFERPVRFFQAGLIHAWVSRRARAQLNAGSTTNPAPG